MAGIEIIDLDKYYGPSNTAVMTPRKTCDIIVGSVPIATWIFGILNENVFQNRLKNVQIEWSKTLTNRRAVSIKRIGQNKSVIYICLSEVQIKNITGKQLLETLVFEMFLIEHVTKPNADLNVSNWSYFTSVLTSLNSQFGLDITYDQNIKCSDPYKVTKSSRAYAEIDDGDILVEDVNLTTIEILDDTNDNITDDEDTATEIVLTKSKDIELLRKNGPTRKFIGDRSIRCLFCKTTVEHRQFETHLYDCPSFIHSPMRLH